MKGVSWTSKVCLSLLAVYLTQFFSDTKKTKTNPCQHLQTEDVKKSNPLFLPPVCSLSFCPEGGKGCVRVWVCTPRQHLFPPFIHSVPLSSLPPSLPLIFSLLQNHNLPPPHLPSRFFANFSSGKLIRCSSVIAHLLNPLFARRFTHAFLGVFVLSSHTNHPTFPNGRVAAPAACARSRCLASSRLSA